MTIIHEKISKRSTANKKVVSILDIQKSLTNISIPINQVSREITILALRECFNEAKSLNVKYTRDRASINSKLDKIRKEMEYLDSTIPLFENETAHPAKLQMALNRSASALKAINADMLIIWNFPKGGITEQETESARNVVKDLNDSINIKVGQIEDEVQMYNDANPTSNPLKFKVEWRILPKQG